MIAVLLAAGLAGTGWGFWRSAGEARAKAEALRDAQFHFARSREVVDRMLTRVAQNLLPDVPGSEPVRREILEDALVYYREFLRVRAKDPALGVETAHAHQRYGMILAQLGRHAEAVATFDEALAILRGLGPDGTSTDAVLALLVETHLQRANLLAWNDQEGART